MAPHVSWSEREQLVVVRLYCRTPFGRLHKGNPAIVALAKVIGRTPSAVAMKACNFASLDPVESQRVKGLGNASRADRKLWARFRENSESVAAAAEAAWADLGLDSQAAPTKTRGRAPHDESEPPDDFHLPLGDTESVSTIRVRRVQTFFRNAVLVAYENRCAISGIANPELLNASHILPWKDEKTRRADPTNGLCLNALHDRAFDRGFLAIDTELKVVVSRSLLGGDVPDFQEAAFREFHGKPLTLPVRFHPDPEALAWHRDHIFKG